jgi:hypothetical protein
VALSPVSHVTDVYLLIGGWPQRSEEARPPARI